MEAMDERRLRLYDLLKPKLDEEPARELVLALGPEPDQLITREYLDLRLDTFDARFDSLGARMDALEARMDARFARLEATLTRRMITFMGAWTVSVASAFAWASAVFR
jgi:hypothetical protein